MGPIDTDQRLRADLRRWSLVGGVSAVVLLVGAALLITLGGLGAGTLGLAGLALVGSAMMLDAVVRLPRPAPYVDGTATVVPASRIIGVLIVLMGVMVSLLAFEVLTEDVSDQRGAPLRFAAPVIAALLLAWGALTTARPTRLVLSPAGASITGVRRRSIRWDEITSIGPADDAVKGAGNTALPLVVRSASTRLDLLTRWTRPTLWVVVAWLEHYRAHPQDRDELAGPAGLSRLEEVEARLRRTSASPAWFPGPETTR